MDTMMLFHYKKTRKRQAITIAINILILPLFLYFFRYAMEGEPNFEEVVATANNIVIVISVVLICLLIWFLKSKEKFEMYVTENEFYSYHPVFSEWCFSVNPKDIKAVEHHLSIGSGLMTNINVHLNSGQKIQVCQNYSFSRDDLYFALKKANPNIDMPDNANIFKHKPNKETDAYFSTRFPITTKIIKSLLTVK